VEVCIKRLFLTGRQTTQAVQDGVRPAIILANCNGRHWDMSPHQGDDSLGGGYAREEGQITLDNQAKGTSIGTTGKPGTTAVATDYSLEATDATDPCRPGITSVGVEPVCAAEGNHTTTSFASFRADGH